MGVGVLFLLQTWSDERINFASSAEDETARPLKNPSSNAQRFATHRSLERMMAGKRKVRFSDSEAVMSMQTELTPGVMMLAEIQEFGSFDPEVQRYICRSLEIAVCPDAFLANWARDKNEADAICTQMQVYRRLPAIRGKVPTDNRVVDAGEFLFPLVVVTTLDLTFSPISTFAQYRFLYERLLGAKVRPWLPAAFAAAAALPHFPAHMRQKRIGTVTSALNDHQWLREPSYFPVWLGDEELPAG